MPSPHSTLRKALVVWLYAAALLHLFGGVTLSWAGHSGLFDNYLLTLEQAFWASAAAPAAARAQQVWWLALFGATLQSYALYMLALVHIGNRLKRAMPWGWIIAGILLWAPQDMLISAQVRMWSHLWLDSLALLVLLPPLFWLYRHDSKNSASSEPGHD
ncbi:MULTISPECIES: cell division protein [Pseudomonas]|uniref:cell division protein n=1 Tax=Pseudomonas TaxID=286 RepID=UPI001BE4EDB3|nr:MULTISPECIES: cell division protein [Pseudomonas]MBT2340724.1 cell division protein [Pseudomonas fluorescens]MCD4529122.1 cell division protein [Pseudomonas sp. C3-2018]